MDTDDSFTRLELRHCVVQIADQLPELIGDRPTDRVRDINGGGAGGDDCPAYLDEKLRFCAGGVLGREFHVADIRARAFYPFDRETNNFILCFAELELAMNFGCGEEYMDTAPPARRLQCFPGGIDVPGHTTRESRNDRPFDFPGNGIDRLKVPIADDWEACLDHIDL